MDITLQGIEIERDPESVKLRIASAKGVKKVEVYSSTIEEEPFDTFIDGIIANGKIEYLELGLNDFNVDSSMAKLLDANTPLMKLTMKRCRPI